MAIPYVELLVFHTRYSAQNKNKAGTMIHPGLAAASVSDVGLAVVVGSVAPSASK